MRQKLELARITEDAYAVENVRDSETSTLCQRKGRAPVPIISRDNVITAT